MQVLLGFLRTPRNDSLKRVIILICGLAEIGVEAEVPDCQREIVGAGIAILLFPDPTAFDQATTGRAPKNTVRRGHRIVA